MKGIFFVQVFTTGGTQYLLLFGLIGPTGKGPAWPRLFLAHTFNPDNAGPRWFSAELDVARMAWNNGQSSLIMQGRHNHDAIEFSISGGRFPR